MQTRSHCEFLNKPASPVEIISKVTLSYPIFFYTVMLEEEPKSSSGKTYEEFSINYLMFDKQRFPGLPTAGTRIIGLPFSENMLEPEIK